jgi:hypothetical protein
MAFRSIISIIDFIENPQIIENIFKKKATGWY